MRHKYPCFNTFHVLLLLALVVAISACQLVPSGATGTSLPNTTIAAPPTTHFTAVKLVRREAQSDVVPAGKRGTVSAVCQPGEQLLSGGFYVYAFEAAADVVASFPSAPDAWTVTDDNTYGPSYVTIFAYATCLQAPYSVGVRITSSASQSSSNTSRGTTANCPPGAVLTGGGFRGRIVSSMPTSSGWQRAVPGSGEVFALCATKRLSGAPAASATFTTQTVFGSPQGASAHCPDGQMVTGGGYSFAQGETAIAVDALAPDATSWGIGAAGGYYSVSVVVWATCVIAPPS
jgi:hypothetical protein